MHKVPLGLIGGGAVALSLSLVLGWLGIPHILRSQIKKASRLQNGTTTFEIWKEIPFPVYMKFHLFNVNNPQEILEGGKPSVTEMGPYTYLEKIKKVDIHPGTTNATFVYRQIKTWYFLPDLSKGSEEDMLTFLNIPFVGVAKMAHQMTTDESMLSGLDEKLKEAGETLFKTAKIRDILFDGVSVQPIIDVLKETSVITDEAKLPKTFQGGTFALYKGRNGSDDGIFEVKTGIADFREFGEIVQWNNITKLPYWKEDSCNEINGTDGAIFVPFLQKDRLLRTYNPDLCRTFALTYEKMTNLKGIPTYRFTIAGKTFQGKKDHEPNKCFCTETDESICEQNGVMVMSGCSEGAPVLLSPAHFVGAPPDLASAVDGMNPDPEKHKTFMDLEPVTAVPIRAAKRIQMNVDLTPYPNMPTFAQVKKVVFPVMWISESYEFPEKNLNLFHTLYIVLEAIDVGKWVLVFSSVGCLCLGALCGCFRKDSIDTTDMKR